MDGMATALWMGLERSDRFVEVFTSNLRDEDWRATPPGFPNCPLWVLGHLAFYRGHFLDLCLGGRTVEEGWRGLFSIGSAPPPPEALPSVDACREELARRREMWRGWLETVSDAELREPCPALAPYFENRAQVVVHLTHHEAHHTGGLSMLSRLLGRGKIL